MKVDLHIHSTFSDSSRSPEEIVTLAKERKVSLISVCDHCTIRAYDTLPQLCHENGITCVTGVELNILWHGEELHMLAYNFDISNKPFLELINRQSQSIECEYIVYNMSRDYPGMSLEDYRSFAYPAEKGGWKYLHYAVARGAARDYEEANATIYARYSAQNHLSGLGQCSMTDFCRLVRQADGVPVLAHPGYLYEEAPDRFTDILREMQSCGVEGIECYYPSHSKAFTNLCVDFCRKNDMRITAGCDCHGEFDKSEGFTIGALDVSPAMLDLKGIV